MKISVWFILFLGWLICFSKEITGTTSWVAGVAARTTREGNDHRTGLLLDIHTFTNYLQRKEYTINDSQAVQGLFFRIREIDWMHLRQHDCQALLFNVKLDYTGNENKKRREEQKDDWLRIEIEKESAPKSNMPERIYHSKVVELGNNLGFRQMGLNKSTQQLMLKEGPDYLDSIKERASMARTINSSWLQMHWSEGKERLLKGAKEMDLNFSYSEKNSSLSEAFFTHTILPTHDPANSYIIMLKGTMGTKFTIETTLIDLNISLDSTTFGVSSMASPSYFIVDLEPRPIQDENFEILVSSPTDQLAIVKVQLNGDSFLNLNDDAVVLSDLTSRQTMTTVAFLRFFLKDMPNQGFGRYTIKISPCEDVGQASAYIPKPIYITVRMSERSRHYHFQMIMPIGVFIIIALCSIACVPALPPNSRKPEKISDGSGSGLHVNSDSHIRIGFIRRALMWLVGTLQEPYGFRLTLQLKSQFQTLTFLVVLGIFYGIPSVQLIWKILTNFFRGDEDSCFYNFLCSHPLGPLFSFNEVLSNNGFIILGAAFLLIVFRRDYLFHLEQRRYEVLKHHGKNINSEELIEHLSHAIPVNPEEARELEESADLMPRNSITILRIDRVHHHFLLYYGLGICMICEGVMSALYHFCPTRQTFQFDTTFMFLTMCIMTLVIHQKKRGDPDYGLTKVYSYFTLIILLNIIGNAIREKWYLVVICFYTFCMNLYAFLELYVLHKDYQRKIDSRRTQYALPDRFISVRIFAPFVMNVVLNVLVCYSAYHHDVETAMLLLVLMGTHMSCYFIQYLLLSKVKWDGLWIVTLAGGLFCAGIASHFFQILSSDKSLSPALSRSYNTPCIFMEFYGPHDIWHFFSAPAVFLFCITLLVLDDHNKSKNKNLLAQSLVVTS